ncbi:uncharacterized protein ACHE_50681A [Aspergillus chevalieri]|uniref:Uncharacterized protein n=1 Tax=Aspergillus chevalieri TaxID=182096 RepID=A0A7R7VSQ6_ASPCH|nr:uncharacterized protein ACHE_50681A [Aspergillus chevalieri]BCR89483.1 hypothetical protein ACHE_50681A [Aspergillus chevalieri]
MSWLTSLLLPCAQPRKPTKDSCSTRSNPLYHDTQKQPTYIDSSGLPQKPHRIARKPSPQETVTPSIRIVEYSDSEPTLEWDEKDRANTSFSDTASFLSDDRTILMPEPDEEAVLVEMRKIESDLAATASPPPPAVTTPRRNSRTTTRTSACLDMIPEFRNCITEAIREEQEPEESTDKIGTAVTTSPEDKASRKEALNEETPAEQKLPQKSKDNQDPEHQEKEEHEKVQEQEQVQIHVQEPEQQPEPVTAPESLQYKREQDPSHLSYLSTRLSRRRSLIEIFNALRASQRSSFRLNLEFSPKFYSAPFGPSSPTSSTTAVSPPMSPVSIISPLSPTLSDETIMVDSIETACAVQIAGGKGPQEVVHQAITPDENIFQFH